MIFAVHMYPRWDLRKRPWTELHARVPANNFCTQGSSHAVAALLPDLIHSLAVSRSASKDLHAGQGSCKTENYLEG